MKAGSAILTPKIKRQGMEWHHVVFPKKNKARTIFLVGIIVGTVFWDVQRCILVDFLPRAETINAVLCVQACQKL
jgi:hypothetical protein